MLQLYTSMELVAETFPNAYGPMNGNPVSEALNITVMIDHANKVRH